MDVSSSQYAFFNILAMLDNYYVSTDWNMFIGEFTRDMNIVLSTYIQ